MDAKSGPSETFHTHDGRLYRVASVGDAVLHVYRDSVFIGELLQEPSLGESGVRLRIRIARENEPEIGYIDDLNPALDHLIEMAAWRYDESETQGRTAV